MADLIPPGQNAMPAAQSPAAPSPPTPGTVPDNAPATPADQAINGADAGGPRATGTAEDARNAQIAQDPTQPMSVDPKEQAEFDQFISRFTLILSDRGQKRPSHVHPSTMTPHDAIMKSLNNPRVPLPVTIGTVTAQIAMMIVQQAQVNKVQYSPDVLFHACFECCGLVYLTGLASGIFKGCPPFKGMGKDGEYPFTPFEVKLLCQAQMQAVRVFGSMELKVGMISPAMRQQNMQFWTQQVHREMSSGTVNQDVLDKLTQSGMLAKKTGSSDPTGEGPQPADTTPPMAQGNAAPAPAPAQPPSGTPGAAPAAPPLAPTGTP